MPDFLEHELIREKTIEKRAFQETLANRVLAAGNSLIVAPTALGKTVIAAIVAANVLQKNPESKILFLSPTKPLAEQHQKSLQKFLNIPKEKILLFTGTIIPEKRAEEWNNATIISATPQTIENDLRNQQISLQEVGLCIFDEAHRASKEYSYVYISEKYAKQAKQGLVLALTASPGSTEDKIQEVCRNLSIKNIEIKTLQDEDIKQFSHEIKIEWERVDLPEEMLEIKLLLEQTARDAIAMLKKTGLAKTTNPGFYSKKRILELQIEIRKRIARHGKTQPSLFAGATAAAQLLKISHAQTLLETQGIFALHDYFERIKADAFKADASRAVKQLVAKKQFFEAMKAASFLKEKNFNHPKIGKLKEILLRQFLEHPEGKALVFNHYRDSIKNIAEFLNTVPGIKAEKFIGQAAKQNEKGMTQKEQGETIQKLKTGELNTLVGSSVAEEGLDLPNVDLVVFYEPVPSEIRAIQRRGRTGRLAPGKVVMLMANKTRDEAFYWNANAKEKKAHNTLKKMQAGMQEDKYKRDKQTTLDSFKEEKQTSEKEQLLIYADQREQSSEIAKKLSEKGCIVREKQLEVGDYVLSDRCIVERKTVKDFLQSIIDGRLFTQLPAMTANYESPMIIVEGNYKDLFTLRNIHRNAIIGALTSIAVSYRTPVLFTENADETAEFLFITAKREQLNKYKSIRLRIGRKGMALPERQRFVIESLPNIGPETAVALLRKFKTIRNISNALGKDLQQLDNLGPKKARQIKKIFWSEYKEE
ncbi:MAG: DEAD/DEAH box helicase [Candidatus ainarchaeum sp.]|nr:DEAD/DEAH box helicase [Candidatus ainarchaeum sp.]